MFAFFPYKQWRPVSRIAQIMLNAVAHMTTRASVLITPAIVTESVRTVLLALLAMPIVIMDSVDAINR